MIYVNQKQLDQVEYLIEQSTRGHHILFDNEVIRQVFKRMKKISLEEDAAQSAESLDSADSNDSNDVIEKHIENLILQPTLLSKKAYLENLTPEVFDQVVYTYFSIVENNIFESLQYSQ